jgi:tRNA guanosine-2'-O-methyltransferase
VNTDDLSEGLSRAIAQYVVHAILTSLPEEDDLLMSSPLLIDIRRFLNENREVVKLREKQVAFFDSYALDSKCSVRGILSIPIDNWGEHIPEHILELLSHAIKGNLLMSETTDLDTLATLPSLQQIPLTPTPTHGPAPPDSPIPFTNLSQSELTNFQTKIIPYDELQLFIETQHSNRQQRNERNIPRQDIIICASLIDKVTNLAGIARTCEIFAVKELIISDLKILKSEDFLTMSVASSNWLPIREVYVPNTHSISSSSSSASASSSRAVPSGSSRDSGGEKGGGGGVYAGLIAYLHEMKREGYQLVGLEQTGGSISLESATADLQSAKCLLLLGREKEGIPVELLNEMDLCIEIPQFGVTRSLNVHVSASLVIWELTKRNLALKQL